MSQYETPSGPRGSGEAFAPEGPVYDPPPSPPFTDPTQPMANPPRETSAAVRPTPDSTTDVAKDQAKQVGQDALEGGQHVAGVAADQAKSVAEETKVQARNLLDEAGTQLSDQASVQQNNLARWLQSLVDELDGMVDRSRQSEVPSGPATSLVRQVADRTRDAAGWLERHEPRDLLAETSRFARQRPGLFLALAAAAGVVAGRLTRGLTADNASQPQSARRPVEPRESFAAPGRMASTTSMAGPATGANADAYPASEAYPGSDDSRYASVPGNGYPATGEPTDFETGYDTTRDRGELDPENVPTQRMEAASMPGHAQGTSESPLYDELAQPAAPETEVDRPSFREQR